MAFRSAIADKFLPLIIAVAGVCMTLLAVFLLISAARLGFFMNKLLGFLGVLFVNSAILSFVAIRMAINQDNHSTTGEKIFVVACSLFTGAALVAAQLSYF